MAYTLNKAMIIGNLTRDPESRTTPTGQNVANFSVATSRQWTDTAGMKQELVEYHNVVAWAKLADICSQYLAKGRKVYVEGRIQTREWAAQDGSKKNRSEIVAETVIILDKAGANMGAGPAANAMPSGAPQGMPVGNIPPQQPPQADEIRIEDIPF